MSRTDTCLKNKLLLTLLLLLIVIIGLYFATQFRGVQADATPTDGKDLHNQLLAEPSSVRGSWLRTLNPLVQDVQGGLVWNSPQQQGVMRFIRLPNPKKGTYYQLWLYDTRSQTDTPVSGATFRQGSGKGEWFVPIHVTTPVLEPYKFELPLQSEQSGVPAQLLLMMQP